MKKTKTCPQCGKVFIGQSNRLYCSDPCKMEAFRAGNTRKSNEAIVETSNPPTPVVAINQPSRVPRSSSRSATDKSSKVDLEIRRLELDHDRQVRQMELEKEERCRTHEQVLARIKADEMGKEAQLQELTKQVDELQRRAIPPLDEWTHFPIGIRRQYQALVHAALTAAKESMDKLACNQWLDEYRPYNQAVQDLVTSNKIPAQFNKPFIWLADLTQQIENHRYAHYWSGEKQDLMLILSPELRKQLMQSCL